MTVQLSRYIVAVDIGGTFSDLVCLDRETGEIRNAKVSSTPPTFIDGVIDALDKARCGSRDGGLQARLDDRHERDHPARRGQDSAGDDRRLPRHAPCGRRRPDRPLRPLLGRGPPLVPRRDILGVRERVDSSGKPVVELDEASLERALELLRKRGIEAVAVVFLNSFMNPEHEHRTLQAIVDALPEAYACCSYDILPELKEFERTSTTVANAYIGPIVDKYLSSLTDQARGAGDSGTRPSSSIRAAVS